MQVDLCVTDKCCARELGRQIGLRAHLNEHQVPDLQHIGVVHVYQVSSIPPPNSVIVDLGAGSTWPLVSHLPEVVLCAKRQDALCWQVLQPAS